MVAAVVPTFQVLIVYSTIFGMFFGENFVKKYLSFTKDNSHLYFSWQLNQYYGI